MRAPDRHHPRLPTVHPWWAVVIRSFAFLRKEVVEILRQPRLVALLVLGPFALLLMFGSGYANETDLQKRAIFVGPSGSVYDEVLSSYETDLGEYIESRGMVATVEEGRAALEAGDVDVVVVFPPDPKSAVLAGERAVIEVLHDQIDPIQQVAIEVAARLAIQEVNATVLATLAEDAQTQLAPTNELGAQLRASNEQLVADPVGTRDRLRTELGVVSDALDGSSNILERLDGVDPQVLTQLNSTRQRAADVSARLERVDADTSDEELTALAESVDALVADLEQAVVLDPDVLVRPFDSTTQNIVPHKVSPTAYFMPASLALLLQHLALTFAALSLVRDRRTGLFELMRVGPLSSIEIIVGKIFAYLLVGTAVGALLVAAAVFGLGVAIAGSVGWVAVVVVGVLLSSLALGMVLAILSGSESQAVQYAMLVLLAGLFFSGFALPLDGLTYPVKLVSWLLPVTYGIDTLQDIVLRGRAPSKEMIGGLAALVLGYGTFAVVGLRRRLRVSAA